MTWFLLAAITLLFVVRYARRHQRLATSTSSPVSTLQADMSKKHSREKRAALDAASSTLR
jgi:hypothetical protein